MISMDAKQLRIGNWVNCINYWDGDDPRSAHGIVDAIPMEHCEYNIGVQCGEEWESFGVEPIPLDEDWLVKFGLTRGSCNMFEILNYVLHKRDVGYLVYRGHGAMHVHCKYVHQLQNLYFALKEEELTIKE